MRHQRKTKLGLLPLAAVSLALLAALAVGCDKDRSSADRTSDQTAAASELVNVRCPIMGSALDLPNVPDNLTREYKGEKVAFCCGGCPSAWDALTDEQKDAKLAGVSD